jgi:hypothetical protein
MNLEYISNNPAVQAAQIVRPLTDINERECVAKLAAEVPDGGRILEIGCLYGGMTAVMGLAQPKAHILCIDDFSWHPADDVPTSPELLKANMMKVGVTNVTVWTGDSRQIGKNWQTELDFVFIDGGHSFDYVYSDLRNFGPHARVVALHDYDNPAWPTVRQAVGLFLADHPDYVLSEVIGTVAVLRRVA